MHEVYKYAANMWSSFGFLNEFSSTGCWENIVSQGRGSH